MDTGYARDLLAALPLLECLTLQGELPALLWDGEGWLEGSHTCRHEWADRQGRRWARAATIS